MKKQLLRCHFCKKTFRCRATKGIFVYTCKCCPNVGKNVLQSQTIFEWRDGKIMTTYAHIRFFVSKPGDSFKDILEWKQVYASGSPYVSPAKPYTILWSEKRGITDPILFFDALPDITIDNLETKTKTYLLFS